MTPTDPTRELEQLLNAWQTAADPSATDEHLINRAKGALDAGLSPYQTVILVIAPHFLLPGEPEVAALDELPPGAVPLSELV
jgi:hypothetical protein